MKIVSSVSLFAGVLLTAFIQVGCSKEEPVKPEASAKPEVPVKKTGLAATEFARIGSETISGQDLKRMVEVLAKMDELQKKKKPHSFAQWANRKAASILPHLAYSMALNEQMIRDRIEPTPASDAAVLARYSKRFKKNLKNETELLKLLGELGPFFHDQFVRESRFEAYMAANSNQFTVSEHELKAYYRGLTNQVKRCEKINAKAKEKINKAWDELQRGIAWDVVATNYTEDAILEPSYADNWYDWVKINQSGIYNQELASALKTMAVGDFTRPIETEEGVIIVRLAAKEDEVYSLARILVRTAIDVNFPEREEAIKELKTGKIEDFTRIALSNAAARVKIEFPKGLQKNLRIWPKK